MAAERQESDYEAVVIAGRLIAEHFKVSDARGDEAMRVLLKNGILIYKR